MDNHHSGPSNQAGPSGGASSIIVKKEEGRGVTDYTYKCRVCLDRGKLPIFGIASGIGEAVSLIAGIHLSEDTHLPRYLCFKCHYLLQGAIKLRKMAQQTDVMLKQISFVSEDESNCYGEDTFDDTYELEQCIMTKQEVSKNSIKAEQSHTNNVDDNNSFHCEICEKDFPMNSFVKHMAIHGIVECKVCKISIKKIKYRRHLKEEHKINNLMKSICEICGKELSSKQSYQLHKSTHFNEFPFKCEICPYRGRTAGLLKTHMKTHFGIHNYQCPECPKRYMTSSNYQRHLRSHRVGQYKCDTCSQAFHTELRLTKHQQVDHLGIRNHICNICGKDFGYRSHMMKHQRKVHKRKKMQSGRMPSYLEAERTNEHEEMDQSLD